MVYGPLDKQTKKLILTEIIFITVNRKLKLRSMHTRLGIESELLS